MSLSQTASGLFKARIHWMFIGRSRQPLAIQARAIRWHVLNIASGTCMSRKNDLLISIHGEIAAVLDSSLLLNVFVFDDRWALMVLDGFFSSASDDQSVRPEAKLPRLCALPFEQMKSHPVAFFEAIWRWRVETIKIRTGQIFCLAGPPFESASNGDVESKGHSRRSDTKPQLAKCWSHADDCTASSNFRWHQKKKTLKGLLHYRV